MRPNLSNKQAPIYVTVEIVRAALPWPCCNETVHDQAQTLVCWIGERFFC